jgi:ArsR family transcriptional regulator
MARTAKPDTSPAAKPPASKSARTHVHTTARSSQVGPEALERAAALFSAMGDAARLRLLELLLAGECCVGELVTATSEKFSTVSQRLRVLRGQGLITRRRDKTHLYYALSDRHVADLVRTALAHAIGCSAHSDDSTDEEISR